MKKYLVVALAVLGMASCSEKKLDLLEPLDLLEILERQESQRSPPLIKKKTGCNS